MRADAELLPRSQHPKLLSYGLFSDEATLLLFKDAHRAFLGLGGAVAVVEASEWWGKPQLSIGISIVSSFGTKGGHSFQYGSESMDVRSVVALEFFPAADWSFSVGIMHVSGHVLEGVVETDLVPPDLGDDGLRVRLVHDLEDRFRLGGTVRALLKRSPIAKDFEADLFAEWFPWGADTPEARASGAPYIALGLEENGYSTYVTTFHAQVGLLYGHHFHAPTSTALRAVVGYYRGADPRLKYFAFRDARSEMIYFGGMVTF